MPHSHTPASARSIGWMGLKRGHNAHPGEWIAEKIIFAVSLSTIAVILLIFVFVGREALPLVLGQTNSALIQDVIPAADLDKLSPEQIQAYLGLTRAQFRGMDRDTLLALMESREEAANDIPQALRNDPDAHRNTTRWRYLFLPHQWSGYDRPEFIWQPVGTIHKYNIIPLVVGSLKVTLVGLMFAMPLGLGAALYVSQLASNRTRELIKPGIELLAGIPSVVMGVMALLLFAGPLQQLFGYQFRLNAFVAGIALGLTAIPLIFSIAEDALTSVPRSYTQAALALGASRWQTAWQVVLPAALPGVFAAAVLGFGRCIGETMVVLIVSGNASTMSWSLFDSTRSITATIAAEMAEAVQGGHHYQLLFLLGTMLFAVTFITNFIGDLVIHRLKGKMEGRG